MFETPTNAEIQAAMKSAHAERAQAFSMAIRFLTTPFRWRPWPQGAARRLLPQPQARPAGL